MGSPSPHSALTAKTRAMYGRRLREADFTRLLACKHLGEVLAYLKTTPGWSPALIQLGPQDASRGLFERTLRAHLLEEAAILCRFEAHTGTPLSPLYRYELQAILWALRHIQTPRQGDRPPLFIPDGFRHMSRLDFDTLTSARRWRDIVQAAAATIYKKALENLPLSPDTGRPPYLTLDIALLQAYYLTLCRGAKAADSTQTMALLGTEADFQNLTHILRLNRHFPHMLDSVEPFLIPVFYKLKPAFFAHLAKAPNHSRIMALLDETVYGRLFRTPRFPRIEQCAAWHLEELYRKQLLRGSPSPLIPAAYLHLRGRELNRLIQAIEEVFYRERRGISWQ